MENPILKSMEEGATVVTGSQRLARVLRREYDVMRRERGDGAWRAPEALPWQGWMASLWEEIQFQIDDPPALLDSWQERALWQRAILESEESPELLQASGAAAAAQEAWALAAEWRLDLALVENSGNEDARVFSGWARGFQTRCAAGGLIRNTMLM